MGQDRNQEKERKERERFFSTCSAGPHSLHTSEESICVLVYRCWHSRISFPTCVEWAWSENPQWTKQTNVKSRPDPTLHSTLLSRPWPQPYWILSLFEIWIIFSSWIFCINFDCSKYRVKILSMITEFWPPALYPAPKGTASPLSLVLVLLGSHMGSWTKTTDFGTRHKTKLSFARTPSQASISSSIKMGN